MYPDEHKQSASENCIFLSERSYRSSCSEFSSVLSKTSFSVVAFSNIIFHCIQFSGVQDTNQSIRFRIDLSNAQNVTSMPSQPHALTELLLLSENRAGKRA